MALPTPPPINNPIPNNPFYSNPSYTLQGPYNPYIVGSGFSINQAGTISASGTGGVASINGGPGIAISSSTGNVTICNAGVLSLSAGPNISLSATSGNIQISAAGGAGGTVTCVATTAALTGGPITTFGTLDLAITGVTAGVANYPASITVDACGRITALGADTRPVLETDFLAKGDLVAGFGVNSFGILPVGTDGQILTACNTAASGLCWAAAPVAASATPTVRGIVFALTQDYSTENGNTGLGQCALNAVTTGYGNVGVGHSSGRFLDTGSANTFVGEQTFVTSTSGFGNTAIGNSAGNTATGSCNVFVGLQSGYQAAGSCNTFVGYNAVCGAGVSGAQNVAIGYNVALPVASGSCQLVLGFASGQNWITGDSTKAIKPGAGILDCTNSTGTGGQVLMSDGANAICWGTVAGPSFATPTVAGLVFGCTQSAVLTNTLYGYGAGVSGALESVYIGYGSSPSDTGACNTFVGFQAANLHTVGGNNVAVGHQAMQCHANGVQNVAIGQQAMQCASGVSVNNNIAIGRRALCKVQGRDNIAIGYTAGCDITTGCRNFAFGPNVQVPDPTGCCQLAVGFDVSNRWVIGYSDKSIKIGAGLIDCTNSCGSNGQVLMSNGANAICWGTVSGASPATPSVRGTVLGLTTFYSAGTGGNTGLGDGVLTSLTTGDSNVAIGLIAGESLTTGRSNVIIGEQAFGAGTSSTGNVAVGASAGLSSTGSCNVFLGLQAGDQVSGNCNTYLGPFAVTPAASGSFNVAIGSSVSLPAPSGSCQLAIGFSTTDNWLTGCSSKAIRPGAGIVDRLGSCGTAGQVLSSNGLNALEWISIGGGGVPAATPTALGTVLGCTLSTASASTAIGHLALNTDPGLSNTAMGQCALYAGTSAACFNVAMGVQSLFCLNAGCGNTGIGSQSLYSVTSGLNNSGLGRSSGQLITTGSENVGVGWNAIGGVTTGSKNVAIGTQSGTNVVLGSQNVAIGPNVCFRGGTGLSCRLAIGFSATENWITGDSTKAIRPEAGIVDKNASCGTANMVLTSQGNSIEWKPVSSAIAAPNYGSFYDTTIQTNTVGTGTGRPITLNTTAAANNFSITSGSRITAAAAGTYNLQFSAQFETTTASLQTIEIWLRINGTNVNYSNTEFTTKGSGEAYFAALNYVITLGVGDYAELVWASGDANMVLTSHATLYDGPDIPSMIATIVPVGA